MPLFEDLLVLFFARRICLRTSLSALEPAARDSEVLGMMNLVFFVFFRF